MDEFLECYQRARNSYSDESYEKFSALADITDSVQKIIGKDIIAAAGGIYLSELDEQETRLSRADMKAEITKARKASADLVRALKAINGSGGQGLVLNQTAVDLRDELIEQHGKTSDTYAITSSIFALEVDGSGFRQTGLENSLEFLAQVLESYDTDELKRTRRNRIGPLTNWATVLINYWFLAKGQLPTVGHYDSEVAERGSHAVQAFTVAAQTLDPDITERLVVDAIGAAKSNLQNDPIKAWVSTTAAMTLMIGSGVTHSPKHFIRYYLGIPTGQPPMSESEFDKIWGNIQRGEFDKKEQAFISAEQFTETLYSTESGIKLSEGFIELLSK